MSGLLLGWFGGRGRWIEYIAATPCQYLLDFFLHWFRYLISEDLCDHSLCS